MEFGADLVLGQTAVGGEVDESGFAFIEVFESSGEAGVQFAHVGLFVGEGDVELGADFGGEVFG
ncbi:hypothetical protein [Mycobacteroides sp. LB1]|uniref:hypothetical protein n=1 Tax=Mycobacteroides sp. LB1 TaxID=2750814 RepID=UPI0015DD8BD7|nr:hypothetical protein [Mycobacteroides sp. LB1]